MWRASLVSRCARSIAAVSDRPGRAPGDDAEHALDLLLVVAPVAARQAFGNWEAVAPFPHPQGPLRHARALDNIADAEVRHPLLLQQPV